MLSDFAVIWLTVVSVALLVGVLLYPRWRRWLRSPDSELRGSTLRGLLVPVGCASVAAGAVLLCAAYLPSVWLHVPTSTLATSGARFADYYWDEAVVLGLSRRVAMNTALVCMAVGTTAAVAGFRDPSNRRVRSVTGESAANLAPSESRP